MSGTMWWGRTAWSTFPDVSYSWQSGWLNITGSQWGPIDGNFLAIGQDTYTHDMQSHFWMSPSRMPPANYGSNTFSSNPVIEIRGRIKGKTLFGTTFDKPDLTCKLILEQTASYGNYQLAHNRNSHMLMDLPEKDWQSETEIFTPQPRTYDFPHVQFDIRRNNTLHIELRAKIELYLEGGAHMHFRPNFEMRTPQWDIW